jgi:hypothetical protein
VNANEKPDAAENVPEHRECLEAERRAWDTVNRVQARNADKSPDEVLDDVTAEVEAVRQESYERRRPAAKSRH